MLVAALAAAGVLTAGAPAAGGTGGAAGPARAGATSAIPATPDAELTAPDAVSAAAIARLQGAPVEVLGERTETSSVFAMPDGTAMAGSASGPVWVRKGGDGTSAADWAPVDLTLGVRADGSVAPVAQGAGLVLSGGGSSALASVTDPRSGVVDVRRVGRW